MERNKDWKVPVLLIVAGFLLFALLSDRGGSRFREEAQGQTIVINGSEGVRPSVVFGPGEVENAAIPDAPAARPAVPPSHHHAHRFGPPWPLFFFIGLGLLMFFLFRRGRRHWGGPGPWGSGQWQAQQGPPPPGPPPGQWAGQQWPQQPQQAAGPQPGQWAGQQWPQQPQQAAGPQPGQQWPQQQPQQAAGPQPGYGPGQWVWQPADQPSPPAAARVQAENQSDVTRELRD